MEKETSAFRHLAAQNVMHHPKQRPGLDTLNMARAGNREAFTAQSVGAFAATPCGKCARGRGPWVGCVVAEGYLSGSCANCHFQAGGTGCTLHGKLHLFSLFIRSFQELSVSFKISCF